jgi:AcrR family transcriptional regulator
MGRKAERAASAWLQAASEALREGGVEAVRVEALARRLGVTKGSFYWHFADREALLAALLADWESRAGKRILARIEAASLAPGEQLALLLETVVREGRGALDPAIRAWSRTDPRAAACLARVDELRLGWLAQLFEALGYAGAEARSRARLAYLALIGEYSLNSAATVESRLEEAARTLAILTA